MKWILPMLLSVLTACGAQSPKAAPKPREVADDVLLIGRIQHPGLTESSGVVVSRKNPAVFWTHNDGGGKRQVLYAMTRTGASIAEYRVTGALLEDWEDIASDSQGHLFLGDIGNNDALRTELRVYRVAEPDPAYMGKKPKLRPDLTWHLKFPQQPFDCESLFIVGTNGFVISKLFNNEHARVYRFPLAPSKEAVTLVEVGVLPITSPVTGADVSKDGKLLGIVAKHGAHVFRIDGDPANAGRLGRWFTPLANHHIEGCTFVEDGLLATAETRSIYVFTNQAFRDGPSR